MAREQAKELNREFSRIDNLMLKFLLLKTVVFSWLRFTSQGQHHSDERQLVKQATFLLKYHGSSDLILHIYYSKGYGRCLNLHVVESGWSGKQI